MTVPAPAARMGYLDTRPTHHECLTAVGDVSVEVDVDSDDHSQGLSKGEATELITRNVRTLWRRG